MKILNRFISKQKKLLLFYFIFLFYSHMFLFLLFGAVNLAIFYFWYSNRYYFSIRIKFEETNYQTEKVASLQSGPKVLEKSKTFDEISKTKETTQRPRLEDEVKLSLETAEHKQKQSSDNYFVTTTLRVTTTTSATTSTTSMTTSTPSTVTLSTTTPTVSSSITPTLSTTPTLITTTTTSTTSTISMTTSTLSTATLSTTTPKVTSSTTTTISTTNLALTTTTTTTSTTMATITTTPYTGVSIVASMGNGRLGNQVICFYKTFFIHCFILILKMQDSNLPEKLKILFSKYSQT
jgi:hypothetical protein